MIWHPEWLAVGGVLVAGAISLGAVDAAGQGGGGGRLHYPPARKADQVDDYHGTLVADPYRWLEDPDAAESRTWIDAENALTTAYLARIPERLEIRHRLTALWNYPRFGPPFRKRQSPYYLFLKNDGLQNQPVLYRQRGLSAPADKLLDLNVLSPDGTLALSTLALSEDGGLLVYGLQSSGSDWEEFRVRDVASGRDRPDVLHWIKFSGASWTHDGAGFFYSRYAEPATTGGALRDVTRFQKLYYHRLGSPQSSDQLIYERPDQPDWGFGADVTDDGRYLIVNVWTGTDRRNRIYYLDLGEAGRPRLGGRVVPLLDGFDASYVFLGNDGPEFYFLTDRDAPRKRIIAIDTGSPEPEHWIEIVPQGADVIDGAMMIHNSFVLNYLHDAHSRLVVAGLDGGGRGEIPLPGLGSVTTITGERGGDEMFFAFTSFLHPTTIFRHDFASGNTEVFKAASIAFDPGAYETEQVFYHSKDGTRIPMFLTYKKGLVRDGANPTLLYGYGGFNINETPAFSVSTLVWLERGGVYAVPNLRGGGEYGEAWHEAGMHEKKQNVFDDCIAAAEYLIRERWTSPEHLAVAGRSNGGLLVGAVMTQRPDLFGAALPGVGVLDMLRFQRFTIGWAWVTEYGSADSASQFPYLYAYSPLHRIRPGVHYPATLITTADHDDRVVPGHSFKFAAALQAAQGGPEPVLIQIETKAGHGAGKPTSKVIEEEADRWAFLLNTIGRSRAHQ
ncbi:MAG TPA: prolyl oligopeptidase family serine peptidase [Gemmatimonadales bacterium]|nr:prolyl oligopeptidase family serine peptidase [Gemmatimonadales bacterium]